MCASFGLDALGCAAVAAVWTSKGVNATVAESSPILRPCGEMIVYGPTAGECRSDRSCGGGTVARPNTIAAPRREDRLVSWYLVSGFL